MPRCPNCQTRLAQPWDHKVFDCQTCGTSLKLQCDGFRFFSSEALFYILFIVLLDSAVGTFYALILGIAGGLGFWYWLGKFSLAVVPKTGSAAHGEPTS